MPHQCKRCVNSFVYSRFAMTGCGSRALSSVCQRGFNILLCNLLYKCSSKHSITAIQRQAFVQSVGFAAFVARPKHCWCHWWLRRRLLRPGCKTNTQTILDTLVGDTFVGHIPFGNMCGTLFWDTLYDTHSCRTLLQNTLVGHSLGTLLYVTLVGHSPRTLLSDTLAEHSCRTLFKKVL